MESYQKFLEETPETAMTPEALRRLADLKIEKEYSSISEGVGTAAKTSGSATLAADSPSTVGGVGSAAAGGGWWCSCNSIYFRRR